jgi:hypothetical protein
MNPKKKPVNRAERNRKYRKRIKENAELLFLHRVRATTFHWPRRDDVDKVHISTVFYGLVTVPNFISGPFTIPEQPEQ